MAVTFCGLFLDMCTRCGWHYTNVIWRQVQYGNRSWLLPLLSLQIRLWP